MFPKYHVIFGFIFSLIVSALFPSIGWLGASLIFLSSILIDIDHYLFYIFIKKDFSLKRAYKWFVINTAKFDKLSEEQKKKAKITPCIFHGIEFLVILFILYFYFKIILLKFVIIGFIFHELLDIIWILYRHYNLRHVSSQIYNIIAYNKNKTNLIG